MALIMSPGSLYLLQGMVQAEITAEVIAIERLQFNTYVNMCHLSTKLYITLVPN